MWLQITNKTSCFDSTANSHSFRFPIPWGNQRAQSFLTRDQSSSHVTNHHDDTLTTWLLSSTCYSHEVYLHTTLHSALLSRAANCTPHILITTEHGLTRRALGQSAARRQSRGQARTNGKPESVPRGRRAVMKRRKQGRRGVIGSDWHRDGNTGSWFASDLWVCC